MNLFFTVHTARQKQKIVEKYLRVCAWVPLKNIEIYLPVGKSFKIRFENDG